jgi:SAM-dependent methyltransferase
MSDDAIRLERQLAAWAQGVAYEIDFWSEWTRTRGLSWPEDFDSRFDPDLPLDPILADLARSAPRSPVRILDVGSGPATNVGKHCDDLKIVVEACDPLAFAYERILTAAGVEPVVRTQFAVAEDLSTFFELSLYDLVHCRNALDHSFDPMRGIVEMLKVTRPGGAVVLRHHKNEAEREDYAGFHHYNFDEQDGAFVIWNKSERWVPADSMPIATRFEIVESSGDVVVVIRKLGEFTPTAVRAEARRRLEHVLAAVVGLLVAQAGQAPPEG